MVTATRTAMTATKVRIYCTGVRKDGSGKACGHLLAEMEADEFVGVIRIKCPKCSTVAEFR